MNLRPSGYEPDELPGCSTPRYLLNRAAARWFLVCRSSAFGLWSGGAAPARVTRANCLGNLSRIVRANPCGFVSFVRSEFCAAKSRLFLFAVRPSKRPLGQRPGVRLGPSVCREDDLMSVFSCALQTWQRPTLPRLKTKYHRRWGVSRPCSEWERVQPPRQNHQVGKAQAFAPGGRKLNEKLVKSA